MVFYSVGSAAGSIASTAVHAWAGWTGVCALGAAISAAALAFWAAADAAPRRGRRVGAFGPRARDPKLRRPREVTPQMSRYLSWGAGDGGSAPLAGAASAHSTAASTWMRVVANWTPTGGFARLFKVMAPFMPAPPPSSPFDWGDPERARELLGEWFELELSEHVSTLHLNSGEAFWELFSTSYGPTKVLADSLGTRREELHHAWVDFFETEYRLNGEIQYTREYLLVVGERR